MNEHEHEHEKPFDAAEEQNSLDWGVSMNWLPDPALHPVPPRASRAWQPAGRGARCQSGASPASKHAKIAASRRGQDAGNMLSCLFCGIWLLIFARVWALPGWIVLTLTVLGFLSIAIGLLLLGPILSGWLARIARGMRDEK